MKIEIEIFQPIFNFLVLIYSVDITISSLLVLVAHWDMLEKPKLLGLVLMRWIRSHADKMKGRSRLVDILFNTKVMAISWFLGGLLLVWAASSTLIELFR